MRDVQLRARAGQSFELYLVLSNYLAVVDQSSDLAALEDAAGRLRKRLGLAPMRNAAEPRRITSRPTEWRGFGRGSHVTLYLGSGVTLLPLVLLFVLSLFVPEITGRERLIAFVSSAVATAVACVVTTLVVRMSCSSHMRQWVKDEFDLDSPPE